MRLLESTDACVIDRVKDERIIQDDGLKIAQTQIKPPIRVTNFVSQRQLPDKLHLYAKRSVCPAKACIGSQMQNHGTSQEKRTNAEIFSQAVEFIEEYFAHHKKNDAKELPDRLNEISNELEVSGTYTLTAEELEFGARTAWRNASRCIGRIQWQNLNFFDARHVRTTKEMFEMTCKHIEFATNNGNIRSCITVFPQRVAGREDFRLWNPQLVSYAGYLQPDGSVIGDPARVVLTRVCEKLGWKGKGGRFDVLPLIFSAPGEKATWYKLPKELILEVELEHPKFDWFAEMNLRWYALPAVSDMLFDVGGIEFPAAPFNGWYMGTEIGARDLCDEQRYNLLRVFGEMMTLPIDNPTSLWKDEVLLEVNRAVLYSFAKAGTTIVDHHTASQQFLQHMSSETKNRGGCPADWVWIVPPISGSITGVYHQEMINYHLKPSFEYQERAWKYYAWQKIELKTRLSTVAYGVLTCVRLMNSILAKRVKVTVLFATETGRSEMFAEKLRKRLSASFAVQLIRMNDYDINCLQTERLFFVVASTFGNGDPPDNGKGFWKSIYQIYRYKHTNNFDLSNLVFSVFGLGSSLYPTFGSFGKNVHKTLRELKAKSLKPVTTGDEMKGQEKLFSVWCDAVYTKALKLFSLDSEPDVDDSDEEITICEKEAFAAEVFNGPRYRIKMTNATIAQFSEKKHLIALSQIHNERRYPPLFPMKVVSRVRLQPLQNKFQKQSLLVRLQPSNPLALRRLAYKPGDHLGVFPSNPSSPVDALIDHLTRCRSAFADLQDNILQVEYREDNDTWITQQRLPPCTLREAFSHYLDITSPPGQRFLASMSLMATDNGDSSRLKKLAQNPDEYKKWKTFRFPSLLDALNEFPSVHVTPAFLLSRLPLLAPRLYSVSSSLRTHPGEVHLTMSLVAFSTRKNPMGPKKLGVCTSFFDNFPENSIPCFVRPAPGFHLPNDLSLPIIMIGAGSGIAPFRSFLQEREAIANQRGIDSMSKCVLFFGCRSKKIDYLYQKEHLQFQRRGIMNEIFIAFSREDDQKKRYVQDEVYEQKNLVHGLLERGAHVYVCGDAQMADGVRIALLKVYTSVAGCDEAEAQNSFDDLLNQSRYHEDVFGAIHSFY